MKNKYNKKKENKTTGMKKLKIQFCKESRSLL